MPELPEVESVRRSLERELVGRGIERVVVRERRLRRPVDPAALARVIEGRRVLAARRRAKYLLVDLDGGGVLMVHLGMSGSLRLVQAELPLERHDHVVLALDDGRELRFNDPRRFGLVDAFERAAEATHPALAALGLEPLGPELTGAALYRMTRGLARPVKGFLMDAGRLVGVGNIYASEALFRAGIHPSLPVGRLSPARCQKLVRAVRATLRDAIGQGGTTLRDFMNTDGAAGYFAVRLRVYGREGEACPRCGRAIRRMVQGGRSTFYCARCQR